MSRRVTRYNKRDACEAAILKTGVALGLAWEEGGPLDGWTWCKRRGWLPVEIKDPKRQGHADEFESLQLEFFARCKHRGAPFLVWRRERDVLDFLGARQVA